MKAKVFQEGIALISEAFPNLEISEKLYWACLSDLDDQSFIEAVVDFQDDVYSLYSHFFQGSVSVFDRGEQSIKIRGFDGCGHTSGYVMQAGGFDDLNRLFDVFAD